MDREEAEGIGIASASTVDDQLHDFEGHGYADPRDMVAGYDENIYDTLSELGVKMRRSPEEERLHQAASDAYWAHLVELGTIEYALDEDATNEAGGEPVYTEDWVIVVRQEGLDGVAEEPYLPGDEIRITAVEGGDAGYILPVRIDTMSPYEGRTLMRVTLIESSITVPVYLYGSDTGFLVLR
jgi:hypothetical protein